MPRASNPQTTARSGRMLFLLMGLGVQLPFSILSAAQAQPEPAQQPFQDRHNAHVDRFRQTGNLAEFLTYLVRLQEDPHGVLGHVDLETEVGRQDRSARELASLGASFLIVQWSEDRPEELAQALVDLLNSPEAALRRGAARLIGAAAIQTDLKAPVKEPPQWSRAGLRFQMLRTADRLRERYVSDTDTTVQAAAKMALDRFASVPTGPGCATSCPARRGLLWRQRFGAGRCWRR